MISHAYIAPENLRKPELLSRYPGLEIGVVRPAKWRTAFKTTVAAAFYAAPNRQVNDLQLPVFFPGDSGKYFYEPLRLYRVVKQFKPDIIHLEEEPWTLVSLQLAVIASLTRVQLVLFTWENLDLKLSFWQNLIERFVSRTARTIIAGNLEAKQRIQKRGFGDRCEILPQFGVDTRNFKPINVLDLKSNLNLSGFIVGFVGRFVEEKGVGTLLEAVAKLSEDVQLLLVSSSPKLPSEFEAAARKLKIHDRVKILSDVSHQELPKYINLMDVFVLPSITTGTWKEQFGRVLVEAMACGVPVVGSSSGAIPEVIDDAGLIFEERNSDDLKSKIEHLKSNAVLRQELAEKGHQRVLKNFTFERIASETARIYSACRADAEIAKSESIT